MRTILITGVAGFIGSHLAERLLKLGNKVIGIDNFDPFYAREIKDNNLEICKQHDNFIFHKLDLTKTGQLNEIANEVDCVVHLAAKAGVRPSIEDVGGYINANIIGTNNLLEWMRQKRILNLVFASSSSVYGNNEKVPFSETDNVDHPISPYAFTKKAGELLNYTYHSLYNFNIINLRFFTVYGPRQRPDLAIYKFAKLISNDNAVEIFGDGSTSRDYTFVDDTVTGIVSAINYLFINKKVYEIINLGNNRPIALDTLINNVFSLFEKERNVVYQPMQPGDVNITFASIEKAKTLLNYNPETPIEKGLAKFVDWYKTNNGV